MTVQRKAALTRQPFEFTRAGVHHHDIIRPVAPDAFQAGERDRLALLGYFDQAHFIKDFKAMVGMTPVAYARSITLDRSK